MDFLPISETFVLTPSSLHKSHCFTVVINSSSSRDKTPKTFTLILESPSKGVVLREAMVTVIYGNKESSTSTIILWSMVGVSVVAVAVIAIVLVLLLLGSRCFLSTLREKERWVICVLSGTHVRSVPKYRGFGQTHLKNCLISLKFPSGVPNQPVNWIVKMKKILVAKFPFHHLGLQRCEYFTIIINSNSQRVWNSELLGVFYKIIFLSTPLINFQLLSHLAFFFKQNMIMYTCKHDLLLCGCSAELLKTISGGDHW